MGYKRHCFVFLCLASFLEITNGQCVISGGLSLGPVPNHEFIQDVFRGIIRSETTTSIENILSISYGGALIGSQPYLDITLVDSLFVVQTNSAFAQYEDNETAESISVTITFGCTGGNTTPLILVINIEDTNNNYPQFIPTNVFEFVLAPPLPPGFLITGCLNEITVRDIDLTTRSIIFEIEENPYFEIQYDEVASEAAGPKHFKALLKTSTFIRTLREPITLRITATDVDATGDPPLTTSGTIRLSGDTEFEFPEEPVFSQTYYFATYTDEHQLIQFDNIFLQQGFDDQVIFTLEGEYREYFTANANGNQVSLVVNKPLPIEELMETQIYLIVKADREYTSGDTATIVIHLPEEIPLMFENVLYKGSIVDNALQLSPLVLSQGYDGTTVSARIDGDNWSSFTAIVQGNLVTVTMDPLTDDIIGNKSFISLPVVALTNRNEATTIVSLEIIKDDNVTPVFDEFIYTGSYDPVNGLTIDQIEFIQGFDDTVTIELDGVHKELFEVNLRGSAILLTSSVIPPELFEEQQITLSINAAKPRTVGAYAAIIITLPAARVLGFEALTYNGTIQDNELLHQTILLGVGFDENVRFTHSGEFSTYFNITNEQNQVSITLLTPLPDSVITQNSVIALTITASGLNALSTSTSVLLDIIKEDTTTPVLSQKIYYGTYSGPIEFEMENIYLTQGYNDEVSFTLDDSAYAQYFEIENTGNSATIRLRSAIPEDVIFTEKVLLFNVFAVKALTVGSNAAVVIRFPTELTESTVMRFSENYYVGSFEQNEVILPENIILNTGFEIGTSFELYGAYANHFEISNNNNIVQISSNTTNTLPSEVIDANDFIILTVEARRERAVSVMTTIVIDIVKEEVAIPVFDQAYYIGLYTENNELRFDENITLTDGYDEPITFDLDGEHAIWFTVVYQGNLATVVLESQIPKAVLDDNNQLLFTIVALNRHGASGRAVISIDLPKDNISFSKDSYKGYIEDGIPVLEVISIHDLIIPQDISAILSGDHSEYFQVRNQEGNLILELRSSIPDQILLENNVLIFTLEIQLGNSKISTVIVLEVIRANTEEIALTFEKPYYIGSYDDQLGLDFTDEINVDNVSFVTISFSLRGDDAQWFDLVRGESSVKLILKESIPNYVLLNNHQLIFEVIAQSTDNRTATATIVISLLDTNLETIILGFDQNNYIGSIENDQATVAPITLTQGYVPGVQFKLHGELSDYFNIFSQGPSVTVTLHTPIPEQSIPANRIVVLEIQASAPQTIPAYATLVLENVVDHEVTPVMELIFAQTYYTGSYTDTDELKFATPISLTDGYDADVQFSLNGDDSQWFTLVGTANSQSLALSSPIPAAVLANNHQLIFVVEATRPGSTTTRATIVISLTAEYTEGLILGFDQVTYRGSIENDQATVAPITLSEGNVQGVQFTLHGELSDYFNIFSQGATVTVTLHTPIPEQSIPANRIVVLEMQASAPQTIPAYATLVLEYVVDHEVTPVVELIFTQTYYTGSYTDTDELKFATPISLTDGYDADVQFSLNGDDSQWFSLVGTANSQTLALSSPIPAAVLANNHQLIFVVEATRPGSTTTRATIVISLTAEYTAGLIIGFDQVTYRGSIENDQATVAPITLSEGNVQGVQFTLHGELSDYFSIFSQGATVTVTLHTPIPEQSIPANRIVVLEMQASAPQTIPAYATLVLEYVVDHEVTPVVELIFTQTYYTGSYTDTDELKFATPISLTDGYDADVQFSLNGDDSQWFTLVGTANSQTLALSSPIPAAVLANKHQLIFVVEATRPGSTTTRATIVISLTAEYTEGLILGFDQVTYRGSIENDQATVAPITLSEGNVQGVQFTLHGEFSDYFNIFSQGVTVTVTLHTPIPEQSIPANRIVVLEMQASAPQTIPAYATLVLEYVVDHEVTPVVELIFTQTYYTGSYTDTDKLKFATPISLTDGYDADVQFSLNGDDSQWFTLVGTANSQTLALSSPIPAAVLANNHQLIFVVEATRPGSTTTRATIVISLTAEYTEGLILGFDQVTYRGSIENDQATVAPITLSEGNVQGVQFTLHGEFSDYFNIFSQGVTVTVTLHTPIPEQSIPANRIVVLEMQASAPQTIPAYATLVLEYVVDHEVTPVVELIFTQTYYTGSYTDTDKLKFATPISLTDGYDADVQFYLDGDDSQWFTLVGTANSQTLALSSPIPAAVLANNQQLIFVVEATRPGSTTTRATIVISTSFNSQTGSDVAFDKVLFEGIVQNGVVSHETITVTGLTDTGVELYGVYSSLFEADVNNGEVTIRETGSLTLPASVTHLTLELRAGAARAVLLLNVNRSDEPTPTLPVVTFSSSSYAVRVEITETGLVGQVHASADNGEAVRYSLQEVNVHLTERLSINDIGELYLSAPVDSGLYTFQVVATTIFTQETGTATVYLSADAITVCGDEIVMPPLIVLDRDEEEPHYNLININEGCHFELVNRWPLDQEWVYVNETGLHTEAIDREHVSIAFMTLSQVQVEITLHCDTDETRVKRSLTSELPDPYDYGANKWVLADTILYNSRRSLVNLIVNDINDNVPVFIGKEHEPIAVGYPVAGLEEKVLPRSLAELQATDADIGENAALLYWSSESNLAVAPLTGFVHIRDGAQLENNTRLTVYATDRNGEGLTGSIDILVRLLDESNILVVTIRDAFLDSEADVLARLSEAVGYEIKVLRSTVISSDGTSEDAARKTRELTSAAGASLQLYVYGLIERDPVSIERLINDITSAEVAQINIASTVSLDDHLAGQEICVIPGRDTGLLAATIVLSVLLFIVMVLIAVWFFLRWRSKQEYDQFSDTNSLASQNEPMPVPKPITVTSKPRLNIEELKKSERRLQEMLDAPVQDVTVEPTSSRQDAILDMPPLPDPNAPIIIQSMHKLKDASDELSEDEFGERKMPKRKSVVTFNENVEKIIHVEDTDVAEASLSAGFEIYKF